MSIKLSYMFKRKYLFVVCFSIFISCANAQITLPHIIGSNMVLQQGQPIAVWGWTKPGLSVQVKFDKHIETTVAGMDGRWQVKLPPLSASSTPQNMTIISDTSKVTLENILVGEVWLCSGQSNMEYMMKKLSNYKGPAKGADSAELELNNSNPAIRLFKVEKKLSTPDVTSTGWHESSGKALEQISAAGYFFAKDLQKILKVPVGIISSS